MSTTSSISSSILTGLVSDTDWTALAEQISAATLEAATSPLDTKMTTQENTLSAWQSFNTLLSNITDYIDTYNMTKDAGYESYGAALTCADTSVTESDVLGVSIGTGDVTAGTYTIVVSQLAQAEKISSDTFASTTAELGIAGDMVLNGVTISIESTDTLDDVVTKINDADTGITASLLNVSSSDHRLQLTAVDQGAAGVTFSNGGVTNVLESLGLTSQSLANESGSDALSNSFSDSATIVGTLLSLTDPQSGAVSITGTDDVAVEVSIDLSTDSLQGIADKINAANITGVTASVEATTTNSVTTYALKMTNVESADLTDSNNVLQAMGVLGETAKNVLQTGQDAKLTVDGYEVTSSSNTVTGVIEGITLTLAGTNDADSAMTLEIAADYSDLSDGVDSFVSLINNALEYISTQNTYDENSTDDTANILMGNSTLSRIKQTITSLSLTAIDGNSTYTTLKSLGISFGSDGTLSLDTDTFSAALSAKPTEVINAIKSFSTSMYDAMNVYVDPTTGTLTALQDSISTRIDSLQEQIDAVTERCDKQAEILSAKFSALETLISESSTTKDYLTQVVDSWSSSS
jgi:flagellar hook-associated protein 2